MVTQQCAAADRHHSEHPARAAKRVWEAEHARAYNRYDNVEERACVGTIPMVMIVMMMAVKDDNFIQAVACA